MNGFEGHQLKVLLVEDNEHFRRLVKTILHAVNIRDVAEAADGASGLERLSTYEADLCIADWQMPGINGLEFVRGIRLAADSPNPYLPIIMCSGYTETSLVMQARDAGVNEFLAKPISARSLLTRVLSVVRSQRSFVKTDDYFGPDRRRRTIDFQGVDRRAPELVD